jgi:predicted secreted protein
MKNPIIALFILISTLASAKHLNDKKEIASPNNKQFFIENKGQWPSEVLFMTKANGMDTWITRTGIIYDFYQLVEREKPNPSSETNAGPLEKEQQTIRDKKGHVIKFNLLQCNKNVSPQGVEKHEAYYNYFIGNDKSKWASFVGLYKEAIVKNIYNGIDIRYYYDNGSLRYDYIVSPGADPKQIHFDMEGAEQISLNNAGEIIVKTAIGETKQTGLFSYQKLNNKTQAVQSFFKKLDQQTFAIALGNYDPSKPLIIDPLVFSTYLGGTQNEFTKDMALDNANNIVVMTVTDGGSSFPTTLGSYRTSSGGYAIFTPAISKLASNGGSLIFSTFLGNEGSFPYFLASTGYGSVALDSIGNIYIAGDASRGLPVTPGCFDSIRSGGTYNSPMFDGYIAKLNNTGSALVYATYFGGGSDEKITDIAIDRMGNAYVVGSGWYTIPTTLGSFDTTSSGGFLAKLNPSGTALVFCTSFKGNPYSVIVDSIGNAIVAGNTSNSSFTTTTGSYDPTYNGGKDGFVTKFNNTGSALIFSTFIGGSSDEYLLNLKVDSIGIIYLVGYTNSSNYPVTTNAYDNSWNGGADMIFGKLNSTGSSLSYSSFMGTAGNEYANSIAFDNSGNIYLSGYTNSSNYPTTLGCFDRSYSGGTNDAIFTKLNNTGNQILYSTFLGGSYNDQAFPILIDNNKDIVIAGCTEVSYGMQLPGIPQFNNFPVTINAFDTSFNKNGDIFITKFKDCIFALSAQPSNKSITIGSSTQFSLNTSVAGVTFQWQQNNGTGFINLSNAGPYTGTTSNTLNINSTNFSFNNTQYRCIVSNGTCNIISDTAMLTINCLFNITRQPTNQSVNQGSNTQFSASASSSTATYQWQQNNGTGFVNLVNNTTFSNVTDDTLVINATPINFNNTSFRCIVTDNACSIVSSASNLTVNCILAVNRQPTPLSILASSNNQFSVATNKPSATYRWQQSTGTGFINLSNNSVFNNVTDDTLLILNAPLGINNTRYRCVITDGPCSIISDSVLLNIGCALAITSQPINTSTVADANTNLRVAANCSACNFQWQRNLGTGFTNLTNNTAFSNVNDDTLFINNANYSLNNSVYRCVVTDGPCTLNSNNATLNVYCVSSITRNIANSTTSVGNNALFSIQSSSGTANFQWQENAGLGFVNLVNNTSYTGANDDTLIVNNTSLFQNNNLYRCLITRGSCIDTSNTGVLTIACISILTQPNNISVNNGANAAFIVQTNNANSTYQWQINTGTGFSNISNSSLYNGADNDTLVITGAPLALNNANFRCITNLNGCNVPSNSATLSVVCTLTITLQPNNQSVNVGNNAQFIVNTNNPSTTFQWQINTGTGFINISNSTFYNGANNDTLIVSGVPFSLNNAIFRCVTDLNGCISTSNNATLSAICNLAITLQSNNQSVNVGGNTQFIVNANNPSATFQWQINTGAGFTNISSSVPGFNDDTLQLNGVNFSLNNAIFRCLIAFGGCSLTSNNAVLNVTCSSFTIIQPINQSVNAGSNSQFIVNTSNTSATFQWQVNMGAGFTNISNSSSYNDANNDTLSIGNVSFNQNNHTFRCIINNNNNCVDTSSSGTLTVICNIAITLQPNNQSINGGSNTQFIVNANSPSASFQWQINIGNGFTNISNSTLYNGANNDTLLINGAPFALNNALFRCTISLNGCIVTSSDAALHIVCATYNLTQPSNQVVNAGNNAQFVVNTSNTSATFQWQINTGTGFTNISNSSFYNGTNNDTLSIGNVSFNQNNHAFRCIINNNNACIDTSSSATLSVICNIAITAQPNSQIINVGNNTQFIVNANNTSATFQWQVNTGSGFININNNALYNGASNDTLLITEAPFLLNNSLFRCIISLNGCTTISNSANLKIVCPTYNLTQPSNQAVNAGNNAQFTVNYSNPFATFQWQVNVGAGFTNIGINTSYNGINNDTLSISNVSFGQNNHTFRCIINNNNTCIDTSSSAALSVICNIAITSQPNNQSVNVGSNAAFVVSSNNSSNQYQWQINIGAGFNNIANSILYNGATSNGLIINGSPLSLNNSLFRCAISLNGCTDTSNAALLTILNTSINTIQDKNNFIVYPNPNNGQFAIDGLPNNATINISDLAGKTIYQLQTKEQKVQINLDNIQDGMYLIKVESSSFSAVQKITISK